MPLFSPDRVPCDYLLEVAGTRYIYTGDTASLPVGESVSFEPDPGNPVDTNAITVVHEGQGIGYVNRAMRQTLQAW